VTLAELNALDADAAARELRRCCGSTRWAAAMAARRPFPSLDAVMDAGDRLWASLDRSDWLEAFAAHPRIGERHADKEWAGRAGRAGGAGSESTERWSAQEQAGVTDDSRARFEELNREYESRFGYIFIVCATGKSAGEMLRILERRIGNNPDDELREAAEAQRQITRLRLAKLIAAEADR